MKVLKYFSLALVALLCLSIGFAWLDPPTDEERQYFRSNLWNLSEREFGSSGVVLGASDTEASTYVYKKQSLPEGEWSPVFKEAFGTDPDSWIQVYDYVLNEIKQGEYYETFGYFNLGDSTYWINNVVITETGLEGELIAVDTEEIIGNISLGQLFWLFWTGEVNVGQERSRVVMLKYGS